MQKVLAEMNLHIHHVFSDVDGASAQAIISAILAGERRAETLAALRDRRCRAPLEKIQAALVGDYRAEYLFVLRQGDGGSSTRPSSNATPRSRCTPPPSPGSRRSRCPRRPPRSAACRRT
jgi:hypothetical protein